MVQETDYAKLGERIKEIRIDRRITQEKLAEMTGCNVTHISNIENNHTKASLNVILAIANALDTSIDFLLSEQYENSSSALDNAIMNAVKKLDDDKKEKILKIIEIL